MRDNQRLMTAFVKIVEGYPEIYDSNLDSYRTRYSEVAWIKCAAQVRKELNEECTVEELKIKWKGIRSSFSRYKARLYQNNNDPRSCKKYYLYDHLRFLEPFTKTKGSPTSPSRERSKSIDAVTESSNYVNVDNIDETNDYTTIHEWNHIEIKPEVTNDRFDKPHDLETAEPMSSHNESSCSERSKKRKCTHEDKDTDDDTEDLQFFKSILPDIKTFTIREKRKLKMGILKLLDDIENDRKSD